MIENENNELKKENNVVQGETQEIEVITDEMLNGEVANEENVNKCDDEPEIKEESKEVVEEKKEEKEIKSQIAKVNNDKKRINKKMLITIISLAVVLLLVISFSVIVCVNKLNNNIYKNVYFMNIDMSGKTGLDVENCIEKENEKLSKEIIIDVYQNDEKIATINSKDIGLLIDKEQTTKDIIGFGRQGNIFKDTFNILGALFSKYDVKPKYLYDIDKLNEILKNIDITLKGRFIEDSYNVDEINKKLIIKRGKSGISLEYNKIKEDILNAIIKGENTSVIVETKKVTPTMINAEEIYNNVKREPQDATVDTSKSPVEIHNEVYGVEFNKVLLQTILDLEENKVEEKEIIFDLEFIEPKVKLRDLSYDLCLEKIAGLTTYFDPSQYGRANNLQKALSYLNDQIIMPGEVFSYNAVIGDTTAAKGYMEAAIFRGGRVVNEMGGGICQTSSTLYNVALMANLQIVERHAHGLPVGYVRPSLDATVYGDVLDFKFKNTRNYPLKIVTSYSDSGEMNISLYGTREDNEYEIILNSVYLYTIEYPTEYINDGSMREGEQYVVYNGVNGYASEASMIKKLNGQVVETVFLSRDVYQPQTQTIRIGTMKEAVQVSNQNVS